MKLRGYLAVLLLLTLTAGSGAHEPGKRAGIKVVELVKSTKSWDGSVLPKYPTGQPEVTILRITVPPHTRLPLHKHSVINAGVLLRGKLSVVSADGKTLHLAAGDHIVELVDKWHFGKNETDQPAEIIVFYAGEVDEKVTIKKPKN